MHGRRHRVEGATLIRLPLLAFALVLVFSAVMASCGGSSNSVDGSAVDSASDMLDGMSYAGDAPAYDH